jgi:thymidylate kinase
MVARGDLAVNLDFMPLVAEAQKQIVEICYKNNLYSIIATELLENFVDNGVMSRSEISDLSLSISQLPSALQLGRETVYSKRPFEAIDILKNFINYEVYKNELYKVKLPKKSNSKNNKNLIVAIEGANGSGKSTLCKALVAHFGTSIKFGVPDIFLQKKLKEKMIIDAHWYSSSLFFISGAIEQIKEFRNSKDKIIISDRSIWSTLSVQTSENPTRLKSLVDIAFNLENIDVEPDLTIILRADYKTCRQRISEKSKDEQKLDELVNSKEFYQKEEQFYNWITFQRDNVINIDVNNITKSNLSMKVIDIINKKLKDLTI